MQVKQGKDPFNFIRKKNARGSIGTISFVHRTFPRELRLSILDCSSWQLKFPMPGKMNDPTSVQNCRQMQTSVPLSSNSGYKKYSDECRLFGNRVLDKNFPALP